MVADQTRLGREGYGDRWESSKARAGGGQLIWLGVHWLDLAQHITGADITQVGGAHAVPTHCEHCEHCEPPSG